MAGLGAGPVRDLEGAGGEAYSWQRASCWPSTPTARLPLAILGVSEPPKRPLPEPPFSTLRGPRHIPKGHAGGPLPLPLSSLTWPPEATRQGRQGHSGSPALDPELQQGSRSSGLTSTLARGQAEAGQCLRDQGDGA